MEKVKNLSGVILTASVVFLFSPERSIAQLDTLTQAAHDIYLSNPDSAIGLATLALNIASHSKDHYYESYSNLLLAKSYWAKGNYRLSTEFGFNALTFFENSPYLKEYSMCLLLLGRTFVELGDTQKGHRFIQQAQELGLQHHVTRIQAEAYREKSFFFVESNDLDSALYYSNKSLDIFNTLGDSLEIAVLNGRKSRIYFRKERYKESRYFAYQSMLIDSLVDNQRGLGISHYLVATNENILGNEAKAISNLHASIKINQKLGNIPWLIKAHDLLARIFLKTNNPEMAAIALQQAGNLKDELYNSRLSGQIQQMNALYDLATKEGKIKLLQHENELKRQQVKSQEFIISFSIVGILLLISLLIVLVRLRTIQNIANRNRAEHLQELDTLKTRFFTNISHEFRTPITLILGPIKELYEGATSEHQKAVLGSVMRNGQRLLRLINQLLDLSKIEAGKMELHTSRVEVVEFVREMASAYESLAANRRVTYALISDMPQLYINFDREKIENVIHNLLSNAFKFTKNGDKVIISVRAAGSNCIIKVSDSGIGISPEQLDKVFDRFYQVDSSHTRDYEGSGLGMALSKELVELHKGTISVESCKGQGTTFTVVLPLGIPSEKPPAIVATDRRDARDLSLLIESAPKHGSELKSNNSIDLPVVLVIEDSAEMRHYIQRILSAHYNIIEARNGKDGLRIALENVPDLIISDIMMPEMDGYKVCEQIKHHEVTSHIPVILLTAKADRESKLSGLKVHAEDYLSKPFDADELRLLIRNRIDGCRKLRDRFLRHISLEPKAITISSMDERFITKVMASIEAHIGDEHFSVENLRREAGFSNMHFYRKIKALSGQTPSEFLRSMRLKRAAYLLAKKSDHVTQIAYSVGFGSVSYFSKCFKEEFGVTPGSFRNAPVRK